MFYKGIEVEKIKNGIRLLDLKDFNIKHILECGQAFRWEKINDDKYKIVAFNRVLNIESKKNILTIKNTTYEDFKNIWYDYFDLSRDYEHIKSKVNIDENIDKAITFGDGIRIIKQDFWEVLISFIISSNNRIPMIMTVIDNLSKRFGKKIIFENIEHYTFPTYFDLKCAEISDIEKCKAGYRSKYIKNTAVKIGDNIIDMEKLVDIDETEAIKEIRKLDGVGPKVADCVLLFSGKRYDVFPVDIWIKRVMEILYIKKETSLVYVRDFAKEYFGKYAGFAQQYLFYYARENRI